MLEIYLDERGEVAIENMETLLKAFPQYAERAVTSALKSEGNRLRDLIKTAIKIGGPEGHKWEAINPKTPRLAAAKRGYVKNYRWVFRGEKGSKKKVKEYWINQGDGQGKFYSGRKKGPLAKLSGAVRYKYDPADQMISIGFIQNAGISAGMLKLAGMHAKGYQTRITPRLRKMLFALGVPVKKSTSTLETPARPVIEPVFRDEKDDIMRNIESKFMASILRYMEK